MALVANFSSDPDALIAPLSIATLYVSAFVGGLMATKINGSSSLVCGLVSGGIFMLALMFLSLAFSSDNISDRGFLASFILHALIIIISILGGYAAQNKPKKTYKPKR